VDRYSDDQPVGSDCMGSILAPEHRPAPSAGSLTDDKRAHGSEQPRSLIPD